jgi:hypothetical protein
MPAVRDSAAAQGNVYAFPPVRSASSQRSEPRGIVANAVASILFESTRSGRGSGWVIGWCLFGLALASLAWLGMIGSLFAAAIIFGVPWLTVVGAFALAHLLAAALAALVGARAGRALIARQKPARLPQ